METSENAIEHPILRVGAPPYVNAKPLVWALPALAPDVQLTYATPRELSGLLVDGKLDVALIPLLTVLRKTSLSILPGVSLASEGVVKNSILYSKVAPSDIKTILIDRSSITSIALLRALFRIKLSMQPVEVLSSNPITPEYPFGETEYDAFLIIGDNALKVSTDFAYKIDLGEQWEQWTHLPFVFFLWAVRGEIEGPALEELFLQAKQEGLEALEEIARVESERLGLDERTCLDCLNATRYDLEERHFKGIERFQYYVEELKICEPYIELKLYHADYAEIYPLGKKV